uniref:Uncharacterized protein n=1 Tax=Meloidogyne enterolobii TaxID=390850 RepID=A0A6V7U9E6_MELEN|nr:unnamed protein product [Meloidogyne enterolobii]
MFFFVLVSIASPSFLILSCLCGALQRIFRPFKAFIGVFRSVNRWGTRSGELAVDKGRSVLTSKKALIKEKAHGAKKKIQKESKKLSEASLARLAKYGITLIIFFLLTQLASSDTISVMSESENCRINNNTRICSVSSSTTLTLLPAGQPTNLLIKDEKGEILGALTFSLLSLTLNCNPKTLAFLRSYRINTRSVWRCPTTGSCTGSFCSNVGANTHVPEVVEVMKEPGASGCRESSALWSKGCGLPTASCHFYRWYAVPTSLDLFELFSCPTWDFNIKAMFQLTASSQTYEESVILQPGLTHHWLNTSITPIAVTNPPSPTLSTPFLTNGFSVALGQDVPRDLKCADAQSALGFGCNISKDACRECHPTTDGSVECQCREFDGEAILADPEKRLPLNINKQTFFSEGESVQVEQPYSPIQIHFRMSNFKLVNEVTESTCTVAIDSIGGCYKCTTGVQIKFSCNTNFGVALAHIRCDDGINFAARCSKEGIEGSANFAYNRSKIETKCKVKCPGGESPLQLQGQLLFIPLKWRRDKSIHSVQGEAPSQVSINLLKFHPFSLLLSNFFPNFQIFIPIIFISIIIIFTIILRFKLKLLGKLTTLFPLLLFFSFPGAEGVRDPKYTILPNPTKLFEKICLFREIIGGRSPDVFSPSDIALEKKALHKNCAIERNMCIPLSLVLQKNFAGHFGPSTLPLHKLSTLPLHKLQINTLKGPDVLKRKKSKINEAIKPGGGPIFSLVLPLAIVSLLLSNFIFKISQINFYLNKYFLISQAMANNPETPQREST